MLLRFREKIKKCLLFFIVLISITLFLFIFIDRQLAPLIKTAAVKRARSVATYVISETVLDILDNENVSYDSIISFEKDIDGKIVAVKTNSVLLNRLKSEISQKVCERIDSVDSDVLSFSAGSLFGSVLLSGKGPDIKVKVTPVGAVTSDFINEFKSAGINQTNHRILVKINVSFSVLFPFSSSSESVETTICAAETLIIGEVPSAYTNVQNLGGYDSLDLTGDIVDFGAHDINENQYDKKED